MQATASVVLTDAQATEVVAALHHPDLPLRVRERLEMVKGIALGFDLETIGAWSGRSSRTVRRWLAAFQTGGVPALTDAPRSGRPRRADATYLTALEAAVDTDPRTLGQPFDVWTSARLGAYLAETTGTRIAPGWLRVLLHRQDFANGRPKHTVAHLQDPGEVAACVERLRVVGGKGADQSGALRTPL